MSAQRKPDERIIQVLIGTQARRLMDEAGMLPAEVATAVNDRHSGMLVASAPPRLYAMHWFNDSRVVLVSGVVTRSHLEGVRLYFDEVEVQLVLALRSVLSAGTLNRSDAMTEHLRIVAESFGLPVTCNAGAKPVKLYSGAWDGTQVQVENPTPQDEVLVSGGFDPESKRCEWVWALSTSTYRTWFGARGAARRREGR